MQLAGPLEQTRQLWRLALGDPVERVDRRPQLPDGMLGQIAGTAQAFGDIGEFVAAGGQFGAGHVDDHARRQNVLGDTVVQFAGDAVPLGIECPRVVGRH